MKTVISILPVELPDARICTSWDTSIPLSGKPSRFPLSQLIKGIRTDCATAQVIALYESTPVLQEFQDELAGAGVIIQPLQCPADIRLTTLHRLAGELVEMIEDESEIYIDCTQAPPGSPMVTLASSVCTIAEVITGCTAQAVFHSRPFHDGRTEICNARPLCQLAGLLSLVQRTTDYARGRKLFSDLLRT